MAHEGTVVKGQHEFSRKDGYVEKPYVYQEYPKVVFREPTTEEAENRRNAVPEDVWMSSESAYQPKTHKAYEAYVNQKYERVVHSAEEEGSKPANMPSDQSLPTPVTGESPAPPNVEPHQPAVI